MNPVSLQQEARHCPCIYTALVVAMVNVLHPATSINYKWQRSQHFQGTEIEGPTEADDTKTQ